MGNLLIKTSQYVAKKSGSAGKQIAHFVIPADIRAYTQHGKSFEVGSELYKRYDQYTGYILRNGKIVKFVNKVKGITNKIKQVYNNNTVVKTLKKAKQKTFEFLKKHINYNDVEF